ncbi:MAG: MFS transporter [Promethearchaeota archaeon]
MSDTVIPRELHGKRLIGYNIGYFGFFLTDILRGVFLFQFYVYTINLNSILVTIGMAMQLIIAAIFSIVFGVMTDNKKPGKLGKRRLFLIYGLPVWFLTNILIWLPPWKCPEANSMYWQVAIYLWVILVLNSISAMSILSSYASMGPEQSQTHENREKLAAVGTFLTIIASILALMLPLFVQSLLKDPENVKWWEPSGKVILFYIPIIGSIFAVFGFISIILTFFSVDETFHFISQEADMEKKRIWDTIQQMGVPAKDKKFRKFVLVVFFTNISSQMLGILVIPFLTYSLKFRGTDYFIYVIISFSCKFGWFYIWKKILKKYAPIKTYSICIALTVIASLLELFFLIEVLSFELKIILFIITVGTILGSIYGFGLFNGPITAALIYEAAAKNGDEITDKSITKISGSYNGFQTFLLYISRAFGSILTGIILFGPNEENPIIITIAMSSMGIFFLMGLLYIRKIELDKKILYKIPIYKRVT